MSPPDSDRSVRLAVLVTLAVLALGLGLLVAWPGEPSAGPDGHARHDPVILVHGHGGSPAVWEPLEAVLRAEGYRPSEIVALRYPVGESNVAIARDVAAAVARVRARTGAERVDLVSHSMGALPTRWYVSELGGARVVDAWVSLAGVNEGTLTAASCVAQPECREMLPGSSLLRTLARAGTPGTHTRYAAFWSRCDRIVRPSRNARLPGATNVETACLDHREITEDRHVLDQVVAFLRA